MGAWDSGPFDNDGAADFLSATSGSSESLASIPRVLVDAEIHTRDGEVAVAVCELIALGFERGTSDDARALAIARSLGRNEPLRLLALRVLPRLRDAEHSELAELWEDEPEFDAYVGDLLGRLG